MLTEINFVVQGLRIYEVASQGQKSVELAPKCGASQWRRWPCKRLVSLPFEHGYHPCL